MYQDEPWTLKTSSNCATKKKHENRTNTLILVEEFLKNNKSNMFSAVEIAKNLNRQKAGTSIAISQLRETGKIKVVKVLENSNSVLTVQYQHKNGPNKALPIIELGSEKGKGLITLGTFINDHNIVNATKFRYKVDKSSFTRYLIKASSNFCYAYREDDLKKLLKAYRRVKKTKVSFHLFKWTVTIE